MSWSGIQPHREILIHNSLCHSQGIPSRSSSMDLIGIPSKSSRGAPSIGAPSIGTASIGTPSTSSRGAPSTNSPRGAPSRSSMGSGWEGQWRQTQVRNQALHVQVQMKTRWSQCVFLHLYNKWDLLLRDVNQTQKDVLQLNEEGIRVDGPILPRSETWHHSLLSQPRENKHVSWVISKVNPLALVRLWSRRLYLKVFALQVSLYRLVCGIEIGENLTQLCLKTF